VTTKKKATVKQRKGWTAVVTGGGKFWYVEMRRPDGRWWATCLQPYTEKNKAMRAARSMAEYGITAVEG